MSISTLQFRKVPPGKTFYGVMWNFAKPWNKKGRAQFYNVDFPKLLGKKVSESSPMGQSKSSMVMTKHLKEALAIYNLLQKDEAEDAYVFKMKKIKHSSEE